MTTATIPTIASINATHLLIVCPRGFANERSVYVLPAGKPTWNGQLLEDSVNPDDNPSLTRLVEIGDASKSDKDNAAELLAGFTTAEEYEEMLYNDGPLAGYDL